MRIRVLGVNASPRRFGNTAKLLHVAVYAAKRFGAEAEVIHLYDYRIEPCQSCLSEEQTACRPPCVKGDDAWKVLKKFYESDAVIVATPVYWYGVPGHLKNLLDKLTVFENMIFVDGRSWVEGKAAGFIAVAAEAGGLETIAYLMAVFNSYGYVIPPWAFAYYHGIGDALESREVVMDSLNLGKILVQTVLRLKGENAWYEPELYDRIGEEAIDYAYELAEAERKRQKKQREELIRGMLAVNPLDYKGMKGGGSSRGESA